MSNQIETGLNIGLEKASIPDGSPSVPKDSFGRILWSTLRDKPDELKALIEGQARSFMETGQPISQSSLTKKGHGNLVYAIQEYYPGQMSGLKENLGFEVKRKPDGYWTDLNNIESEARKFIDTGQIITQRSLDEAGMRGLAHAVSDNYPGGMKGLREHMGLESKLQVKIYQNIEIPNEGFPRDSGGRLVTSIFRDQPEEMQRRIEEEAKKLVEKGLELTEKSLKTKKMTGFLGIIDQFYPEGRMGLRNALGLLVLQRPAGYWGDPEVIEAEARKFLEKGSKLTQDELIKAGMSSFSAAIGLYYPGRIYALRAKLGLEELYKPRGYWTPENIEAEARIFIESGNKLTSTELKKTGKGNFVAAIVHNYPGGIRALREKFGIKQPVKEMGYWKDIENIEKGAEEFIRIYGTLTQGDLNNNGEGSLCAAIQRNYPGGLRAIKEKFGIRSGRKPDGYWTPENIEEEARRFLEKYGSLTRPILTGAGRLDLDGAINFKYPGKMTKLKEKIGIVATKKPPGYWDPESVKLEAEKFFAEFGTLNHGLLKEKGRGDLSGMITKFYPGKMAALQKDLGDIVRRRPMDSWSREEVIQQALDFYNEHGELTQIALSRNHRGDLLKAIASFMGSLTRFKVEHNLSEARISADYWTIEKIEEEAAGFYSIHGTLNQKVLVANSKSSLRVAITKRYPGGVIALKEKLGISAKSTELAMVLSPEQANEQLGKLLEVTV